MSCIPVSIVYLTYPSSKQLGASVQTWQQYSIQGRMVDLEIKSNLERRKPHRTNQGANFLGGSSSNKAPIQFRAAIQFRRQQESQHLTRRFFFKNRHTNIFSKIIFPFSMRLFSSCIMLVFIEITGSSI